MDYFQAIIFALVEGITEFLPISSTGHLVLTAKLLNIPQTEFVKSFEIIIQLGAILAVLFLYWKTIWTNKKVWKPIILAFIPTALVGGILYKLIKNVLIGNEFITLSALFIGGIVLIAIELFFKDKDPSASSGRKGEVAKIEDITPKNAVFIGLFQSISIIPGVSRAAATIIGAMLLKTQRKTAVEFSFLLAIPTMFAATGMDLIQTKFSFTPYEYSVLAVGFIGSFIVAIFAVKFFLKFIQNHSFSTFGIYRIVLAFLFFLLVK
jgi:undecaprenyl-diphosphatase